MSAQKMINKDIQITGAAIFSYSAIFFSIISGLFYTPWMVRTIGEEQYALYTLAMSIVNLFMIDFGISSAITKFLSMYYAKGEQSEAKVFIGIVYKIFGVISLVVGAALLVYYFKIDSIYNNFTAEEIAIFKRLYVIVGAFSVVTFPFSALNGILMANEKFIAVKACNLGQKISSVVLIILSLKVKCSVYVLIFVHIITHVVALMIKYWIVNRKMHIKANYTIWDSNIAKRLFGYSAWSTVSNLAGRCIFNIMPTLIAVFSGTTDVTIFSFAATLEGYVYTFSDAINGLFMPRISKYLINEGREDEFNSLLNKVAKFHVYTIGLIYIAFISVGKEFVYMWLGQEYEKVYWCAILLIFPSVLDVPQQVARSALLVKDIVKEQAFVQITMAIVNVIVSIALLPRIGIVGAAVAVCISYLIRTLGMNILYKKYLDFKILKYFKNTYGKWIVIACVTLFVIRCIKSYIIINGVFDFFVVSLLIVLIYSCFVIAFNSIEFIKVYRKFWS